MGSIVFGDGSLALLLAENLGASLASLAAPPDCRGAEVWNLTGMLPTAASSSDAARALESTRILTSLGAARFHHVSTIAVGGAMSGRFTEKHFDEGQDLDSLTAQAAFDQERHVRNECPLPWRIYRPALMLGSSVSGEIDALDGPALFFRALEMTALTMRQSWTLFGPDFGRTDVVPVDFVATALASLGGMRGLDGATFHLGSGAAMRTADVHNAFASQCNAPTAQVLELATGEGKLAHAVYSGFMRSGRLRRVRSALFRELGIPEEAITRLAFDFEFDCTDTAALLAKRGVFCPPLEVYADKVWSYWRSELRSRAWLA